MQFALCGIKPFLANNLEGPTSTVFISFNQQIIKQIPKLYALGRFDGRNILDSSYIISLQYVGPQDNFYGKVPENYFHTYLSGPVRKEKPTMPILADNSRKGTLLSF